MPQTQEVSLPQVVGQRLLVIADYQRPYAWDTKQLEDLWEDLDLLGPVGRHYAGTLVLRDLVNEDGSPTVSMSDDGGTLRHSEVVDGQQRMTTCMLLLDRVRRRLAELESSGVTQAGPVVRGIRNTYGL